MQKNRTTLHQNQWFVTAKNGHKWQSHKYQSQVSLWLLKTVTKQSQSAFIWPYKAIIRGSHKGAFWLFMAVKIFVFVTAKNSHNYGSLWLFRTDTIFYAIVFSNHNYVIVAVIYISKKTYDCFWQLQILKLFLKKSKYWNQFFLRAI